VTVEKRYTTLLETTTDVDFKQLDIWVKI